MNTKNRSHRRPFWVALTVVTMTFTMMAQERDRSKVPDRYKWNLAELYPTETAWRTAKDTAAAQLPNVAAFKGKLASSAATLADALTTMSAIDKELSRLFAYAAMLADQDTRDSTHQGM